MSAPAGRGKRKTVTRVSSCFSIPRDDDKEGTTLTLTDFPKAVLPTGAVAVPRALLPNNRLHKDRFRSKLLLGYRLSEFQVRSLCAAVCRHPFQTRAIKLAFIAVHLEVLTCFWLSLRRNHDFRKSMPACICQAACDCLTQAAVS